MNKKLLLVSAFSQAARLLGLRRRRIAAFAPATALLLFVACGGTYDPAIATTDGGTAPGDAQPDGALVTDASRPDAFVPPVDSATDADATLETSPFAKITLVNATTDLGPNATIGASAAIRLCFKQGTTQPNLGVAPYPPLPDRTVMGQLGAPGIYHGAGTTLPSLGLDIEGRLIVPIVMNAKTLAAKGIVNPGNGSLGITCDELVGDLANPANNMVANVDYWELPRIPAGTFKKQRSYVIALVGCVGDATITNTAKCGAGFAAGGAGVGNLAAMIYETTRTPVAGAAVGVQFLQASAQASAVLGTQAFKPGFVVGPATGAGFRLAVPAAGVLTWSISALQAVSNVTDNDSFALAQTNPAAPPQVLLPTTLPNIQALSGLGAAVAPTVYTAGKNFVFIAVGDPGLASVDPKSFHFLAFAADPNVVPYQP